MAEKKLNLTLTVLNSHIWAGEIFKYDLYLTVHLKTINLLQYLDNANVSNDRQAFFFSFFEYKANWRFKCFSVPNQA